MSSEQPRRARESGGAGSSPIGSTAAIIIAVVAVVAGFLILRAIRGDDGGTTVSPGDPSRTTLAEGGDGSVPISGSSLPGETAVPTTAAVPTTVAQVTTGATVVVANASEVNRVAAAFSTALQAKGFTLGTPADASGPNLAQSIVYYTAGDAAAQQVAASVAALLGGIPVEVMPTPPPVAGGTLESGVTVLLMVGTDRAGKTLEQIAAGATGTTIPGATATSAAASTAAP